VNEVKMNSNSRKLLLQYQLENELVLRFYYYIIIFYSLFHYNNMFSSFRLQSQCLVSISKDVSLNVHQFTVNIKLNLRYPKVF
ncbi:hypothetical protein ACJX0J_036859, partial [Zea mays]